MLNLPWAVGGCRDLSHPTPLGGGGDDGLGCSVVGVEGRFQRLSGGRKSRAVNPQDMPIRSGVPGTVSSLPPRLDLGDLYSPPPTRDETPSPGTSSGRGGCRGRCPTRDRPGDSHPNPTKHTRAPERLVKRLNRPLTGSTAPTTTRQACTPVVLPSPVLVRKRQKSPDERGEVAR